VEVLLLPVVLDLRGEFLVDEKLEADVLLERVVLPFDLDQVLDDEADDWSEGSLLARSEMKAMMTRTTSWVTIFTFLSSSAWLVNSCWGQSHLHR
jgi:hypothetical protein